MAGGEFTHEPAPPSPRPHSHSLQLLWQVSRSRRRANADGKVVSYEQEEGGCWCTVVEGIKAEAEATSFIVQLLSELYKATILVAALACGGGCAAGWPALLLPPFELGAFAHTWCTL